MITLNFQRLFKKCPSQLTRNYRPHFQPFILIYPTKLLYDMYSRCNVISRFSFSFLSIVLIESVKHLISNGDCRLSFSISLSLLLSHSRGAWRRHLYVYMHRSSFCLPIYMLFSLHHVFFLLFFFFFSIFLFFSLDYKRTREKERHINRGRWWRAHCWFFPSFYSCVYLVSTVREGMWFESRLGRSLFFFFFFCSGKVHRSVI